MIPASVVALMKGVLHLSIQGDPGGRMARIPIPFDDRAHRDLPMREAKSSGY